MADEPVPQDSLPKEIAPENNPSSTINASAMGSKPVSRTLLITTIIVVALIVIGGSTLAARFLFGGAEDSWVCIDDAWTKHGNPSAPMPTEGCGKIPAPVVATEIPIVPTSTPELGPVTDTPDADKRSEKGVDKLITTILEKCPGLGVSPVTSSTSINIPPKSIEEILDITKMASQFVKPWLSAYKSKTACEAGRLLDFKWSVGYGGIRDKNLAAMVVFSVKPFAKEKSVWLEPASYDKLDKDGWIKDKTYLLIIGQEQDTYAVKSASLQTTDLGN